MFSDSQGKPREMRLSRFLRVACGLGVVGAFGALSTQGCSVIVDTSACQCTKDADCANISPGATCDVKNCVCIGDTCSKNADCAAQGNTTICRQTHPRKCVPLTNADCPKIYPNDPNIYLNDDAVLFGVLTPLDTADVSTGESIQNGAEMGVDDINAVKLPAKAGQSTPRPIAIVVCNDQADNMVAERAAGHLVDDLGVQAIAGDAYSGITIGVAQQVTIPKGILLMSPSATSTLISTLPKTDPLCLTACGSNAMCQAGCPPLLWRTSPPDTIQGAAVDEYFASGFEQKVRTHAGKTASDPINVAIAYKGDAYGTGLKGAVESSLKFNGLSALSQIGTHYNAYDYGNPDDPTSDAPKYNDVVVNLETTAPDVILVFGTNEGVVANPADPGSGVFTRVEQGWMSATKPVWLFSDGGVIPELVTASRAAGAANRVFATAPGTNNQNFLKFVSAYNGRYQGDPNGSPEVFGAAGAYDIMYLFSFAAVAAKSNALTGDQLARDLSLTTGGTLVPPGSDNLSNAFQTLEAGTAIQYDGASGPLHWDLSKGEAPSDIEIFCIPQTQSAPVASGVIYSGASGMITGQLSTSICSP